MANQEPAVENKILIEKKSNLEPIISWKDNKLVFDNISFHELANQLERWYNVKISIENERLGLERFSGKFDTETVEQALNALKLVVPFEYKMIKNHIFIDKAD